MQQGTGLLDYYGAVRDGFMKERRTVTRGGVARLGREWELINESTKTKEERSRRKKCHDNGRIRSKGRYERAGM
jgi:hypothetical protein